MNIFITWLIKHFLPQKASLFFSISDLQADLIFADHFLVEPLSRLVLLECQTGVEVVGNNKHIGLIHRGIYYGCKKVQSILPP